MAGATYIGLDEIEPANFSTCGTGLLQFTRPDIVGTDKHFGCLHALNVLDIAAEAVPTVDCGSTREWAN